MDTNKIVVTDDKGNELELDILFTFEGEENKKSYVLYYDSNADEPSVYASEYDNEGNLFEITDPKEWELINEVFESFVAEEEADDDHEHHHGEGCHCHEHDGDHECCEGEEGECQCHHHDH